MSEVDPLQTHAYDEPSPAATGSYAPPGTVATLVQLLDRYLADLQAGKQPDRDQLRAEHPELAAELEQCLSGIDFVHRAAQSPDGTPAQLGEFRIVREIGRGGMGVVYEAEQLSLGRKVALKVLRFGGVADKEAMQRFQREAETVARLHHTNVVPIFAVGCEQGVHYYAMQYIEGRTLAIVLQEAPSGLDPKTIANFGLQAAEALAHAHQRGVIHRDVKPSNFLLDGEGVLWLTDFGLARRHDEVVLTVTGVLMGTPRYMSPEQAGASRQPIDHRTDIYSLGATLYELLTGKPVFDANTPQGVLTQILHAEPIPPRQLTGGLPNDLETVVLKCLAKEPERRYQTAQELAADLRAFLDGRPIRARRPSLTERAVRWVRKHRRSAALMAVAATTAVVLMVGGILGLEQYRHWQTGTLILDGDGPGLTGELLDEAGRTVVPRFTIPTEEPLALPSGSYHLHVSGRGYLDETFQVRVERGQELAFTASLKHQRLWEPLPVELSYECLRFGDRNDVLALSRSGVSRVHGGTGATLWSARLDDKNEPRLAEFRWDWDTKATPSGRNELDRRPRLLQPGVDLDGDGVPDLVWASRRQAAVLAVSGKTGAVLWCFQAPATKLAPGFERESASTGVVLGVAVLPDVNGDGVPDLAVTFASQQQADGSVPRWLEALSGRTGKSLWRRDFDAGWFQPPASGVPFDALWDNQLGLSSSSGMRMQSGLDMLYDKDWLHISGGVGVPYPAEVARIGGKPAVVVVAGTRLLGLDPATGEPLWPAHDLGFWPLRAPQIADLDGRGESEVLLLGLGDEVAHEKVQSAPDPGEIEPPDFRQFLPPGLGDQAGKARTDDRLKLVTLSLGTRQRIWETAFRGYWGWNWFQEPFAWPVVADLDGDGKKAIIVPTGDFEGATKWSGVQVCDGATGAVRWVRKLSRASQFGQVQQVNRILVGPHADADGSRPVFTAVLGGEIQARDRPYSSMQVLNLDLDYNHPVLLVDALSGKDGRGLWWARQALSSGALITSPKPSVGELRWWQTGEDGWPQLVVPYVPGSPQTEHQGHPVYFLAGRTGKVVHIGADYRELRTVDLDGDGTLDLLSYRPKTPDAYDQGGTLETIRGHSPEAWRRLGGTWKPAGDLNQDGSLDLVSALPVDKPGHERARPPERANVPAGSDEAARRQRAQRKKTESKAISGRDGHILWQRTLQDGRRHTSWETTLFTNVHPLAVDLDGDGVHDLLATGETNVYYQQHGGFTPLVAVSGRTGARLWDADITVDSWSGPQLLECRDLAGNGQPEIVFVSAMDWGWERQPGEGHNSNQWQYWLAVLSGRDGRVRWKQPLCERELRRSSVVRRPFSCVLADLNGDGVLDIIVEAGIPEEAGEVRAYSGKDGTLLWRRMLPPNAGRPTLAVGDLDGSGRTTVVVLAPVPGIDNPADRYAEVVALDGADGHLKWSWREPVNQEYNEDNWSNQSRVTPLLVRLDGGRRAVCVWTYHHKTKGQIVLLDAQGKEWQRQAVKFRLNGDNWRRFQDDPRDTLAPYYSGLFRVWAVDLDGNGIDNIVYFGADRVRVLSDGLAKTRYEWRLPDDDCDLLEVVPKTPEHPALLGVRAGGRVVFLGSAPEKPNWTCTGPGTPQAVLWESDGPRVVYDLGHEITVCRIAQVSGGDERGGLLPLLTPEGEDPRFAVPLPWYPLGDLPPLMPSSPLGLAAALLGISVAVLIGPALALFGALRRRAWLWCLLPAVCLGLFWGAAVLLFLAQLEDEATLRIYNHGEWGFAWRVGRGLVYLALTGLPLAAFVVALGAWLLRGRWVRGALLLVVALGLAAALGVAWVRVEPASSLGPEQHYSWRGWWAVWPAGVYAAGLLVLAGFGLLWAVRLGRAGVRRLFRGRGLEFQS